MSNYHITGHIPKGMHVESRRRSLAVRAFRKAFPDAVIDTVTPDDGRTANVAAICDACEEPIFDDEDDVGQNCNLHERCKS